MRAIQIIKPRKIAMLDDIPMPEPVEGEVLVKCSHVAICGSNMGPYTGTGFWGEMKYPNPIGWAGHENIGTIVKSRCKGWDEGTLVLAQPEGYFGFAEYIVCRPPAIARLPQNTPDPGAMIVAQPLATVLRALSQTDGVINKTCAVIGQGSQGLVFTHILRLMGAKMVIATDILDWRLDWAKRYGADHVINAAKQDTVEVVKELTNGEMVDFAVEVVGFVDSLKTAAYLPKRNGRLFIFGMPHYQTQEFPWYHVFRKELEIKLSVGPECGPFFQIAADMVLDDRSSCLRDMVTPRMPWDKAPEAFDMYADYAKGTLKLTLEL